MRSALRRALVTCFTTGGGIILLTLATVHPLTVKDTLLHTKSVSGKIIRKPIHGSMPHRLLSGIGSWYGDLFDGQPTASGEAFDQNALTACHPTLPFGTLVRVINLRNRRSVVVRINDRGVRSDRIIDLSSAAAEKIGMLETGLAPVRLEILHRVEVDQRS